MRRHIRSLAILLPAGLLLAGILPAQTRQAVTIPFPRGGRASVGLTNGPMLIRSVELEGRPSAREIRRARRDRDDKTTLRWIFRVSNAGRRDWHARIRVRVLAPDGEVLASNDREGEVNARDWRDHVTVWTRIRTIDYARADRVLIEADFYPD